jgi:hypothetical protein
MPENGGEKLATTTEVFERAISVNRWGSEETPCGPGSTLKGTEIIRTELSSCLTALGIKTLVDAPCGDCNWIFTLAYNFDYYIGCDIVPQLISTLQVEASNERRRFQVADIVKDLLPTADAVLCRDCLVHLPLQMVQHALQNFMLSGFEYALLTTYPGVKNIEIPIGRWRQLDMEAPPFSLPPPISLLKEEPKNKFLGVWKIKDWARGSMLSSAIQNDLTPSPEKHIKARASRVLTDEHWQNSSAVAGLVEPEVGNVFTTRSLTNGSPLNYSPSEFSSLLCDTLVCNDWASLHELIATAQYCKNAGVLANHIHQVLLYEMRRNPKIRERVPPSLYQDVANVLEEQLKVAHEDSVRSVLFTLYSDLLFRIRENWTTHNGLLRFERKLHDKLYSFCVEDLCTRGGFPTPLILKSFLHHLDEEYKDCANALRAAVLAEAARNEPIRSYHWGAYTYLPPTSEFSSIIRRKPDPSTHGLAFIRKSAIPRELTIVFCVDNVYFCRYYDKLVASLAKFGKFQVHFHIVNPTGEEAVKLDEIGKRYENCGISASISSGIPERYFYATARILLSFELLTALESSIVIYDADIQFLQSPYETFRPFRNDDAVMIVREGFESQMPWQSIIAQAIYLNNSQAGREIAKSLVYTAELFLSHANAPPERLWWIDQNIMFFAYKTLCREGYRIGRLRSTGFEHRSMR